MVHLIENARLDPRDNMVMLACVSAAASIVGSDFAAVFRALVPKTSDGFRKYLGQSGERELSVAHLRSFGWSLLRVETGASFESIPPSFGRA